jgi:hypothetical protein
MGIEGSRFHEWQRRVAGSEEIQKVGKGILKCKGKPPYSLESWWFFFTGIVAIRLLENL